MSYLRGVLTTVLLVSLAGCNSMKLDDFADKEPSLSLESYFAGDTWAWGIFEDRFGNLKRSFQVTINGYMEQGELVLEEDFVYDDGELDRRVWRIKPLGDGRYEGRAVDIVGVAEGQVVGNALNWSYLIDLPVGDSSYRVKFDDWMFLQPNDVLINKATVTKFGIHVGTVLLFFSKQPPANTQEGSIHTHKLKVVSNENDTFTTQSASADR